MPINQKNKNKKMESSLAEHRQYKKKLEPPFTQIDFTPSSWINDRPPDMLWAVLAIEYWPRNKALSFFRHVGKFVHDNPDCHDVTFTGINKYIEEKRQKIIRHITSWSTDTKEMLRPTMLFDNMPAISDWKMYLEDYIPEKDWERLSNAILKTLWHQSEEATDCRWIKILCEMLGGKLHFNESMKETALGILEYPNYGDLSHIKPTIRALEITPSIKITKDDLKWPMDFWKACHKNTLCSPEKSKIGEIFIKEDRKNERNYYLEETRRIRMAIIEHFFNMSTTTAIDARYDACFGFSLYAFTLFTEIVFYNIDYAIAGRMILRALVECLITFKYLFDKDNEDLWKSYRAYGSGQAKLIYLKLQELKDMPDSIDIEVMEKIANEDMWLEFVSINLGHWDNIDLRKMSEEVGLKEIYDRFYSWTSGYIHASWTALRESVYGRCFNPLHRFHKLPTSEFPMGKKMTLDAMSITNSVFDLLDKAYPPFKDRLHLYKPKSE